MYKVATSFLAVIALILSLLIIFTVNSGSANASMENFNGIKFDNFSYVEKKFEEPESYKPLPETGSSELDDESDICIESFDIDENASDIEAYCSDSSEPEEEEVERHSTYSGNFKRDGVVYGEDGTKYTWYSENVLPGGGLTELNNNGRWVDDDGFIRDGDGYIAVASDDYSIGTVLDTPFGQAKVYDCGCPSGTVDVYVSF